MTGIAILLVDDHPVVREGCGYRVVAAAAYQRYQDAKPDVVVMDLSLPGVSGLDAVRHIRRWDRQARILVFTMHSGAAFAEGVRGLTGTRRRSPVRVGLTFCLAGPPPACNGLSKLTYREVSSRIGS